MDQESGLASHSRAVTLRTQLLLAYQSLGIVHGDLITSPIYVYQSTFGGSLHHHLEEDEIFGVLSLVFWSLTLIPLCKYIIIVLRADDDGEGGTFALYSLLCRHAKLGLLSTSRSPSDNPVPETTQTKTEAFLKRIFDDHRSSQIALLLVVLLGTSMLIGDGILTPAMSVLAAISGIRIKVTGLHENYTVLIACIILVGLFALQRFGTHRVGFMFAPILLAWLLCLFGIGIYNVIHWNHNVVMALSPHYIYKFFKKAGKDGWRSLGGIVLCITGAEAMFADLGHFTRFSITIVFSAVVYPCMIAAYMGEAAYLSKNKEDLHRSFYKSIPEPVFWPVFVISTLATIVASQAIISGTFSIISQCRALKCFPAVKIKHTSDDIHGQIYIPEVNWSLMVMCLAVVIGFRDTRTIGNAYGLAVVTVMFVTTCLMFFVIVMVWKRNVYEALVFVSVFGSVELVYFSSCLMKVPKGGWLPLIFSVIVLSVMCTWHYVTLKKRAYELQNGISIETLLTLGLSHDHVARVPGICLVYSNVANDVPLMFTHFVTHFPTFHHFIVFVTFHPLTVARVPADQQIHIRRMDPPQLGLFRCVVTYGYKDSTKDGHAFEAKLLQLLDVFIMQNNLYGSCSSSSPGELDFADYVPGKDEPETSSAAEEKKVRFRCVVGKSKLKSENESASTLDPLEIEMTEVERELDPREGEAEPVAKTESETTEGSSRRPGEEGETKAEEETTVSSIRRPGKEEAEPEADLSSTRRPGKEKAELETDVSSRRRPGKEEAEPEAEVSSSRRPGKEAPMFGSFFKEPKHNLELIDFREAVETAGVVCMMANTRVKANKTSSFVKKFAVNIAYRFLRQNCRRPATSFGVPHHSLIEVGMVYSL